MRSRSSANICGSVKRGIQMEKDARIYVAGHTGLVGSAFVRQLRARGYENLLLRTHGQLDLTRQADVEAFFAAERPEYVIDAAAMVGGIRANTQSPADFYYINMAIQNNLIWTALRTGVRKFLFLGSACQYPRDCAQPMKEEELLTGIPEPTNEGYALAKIGGCRLCSYIKRQYGADFISTIPANAYGIGDSFDPERSHVIPALILKYHNAKLRSAPSVELWGTGKAMREFLYADDIADGGIFLLENYSGEETINMGSGSELSILELSQLISRVVGYEGEIVCDPTKPDGMLRRMVDSSRIHALGWHAKTDMETGLRQVYWQFRHGDASLGF